MDKEKNWQKEALSWAKAILIVIVAAIIIRSFVFCTVKVRGESMEPLFAHGDIVAAELISYRFTEPKRDDFVICSYGKGSGNENLIKRVIGVPGDEILIYKNVKSEEEECIIEINGVRIDENYLLETMTKMGDLDYPIVLAEGEYFLMGDNRNFSADSRERSIGPIKRENIKGRVRLRIFPFNKMMFIED